MASADRVITWARGARARRLLVSFYIFAKESGMCPDIVEDPYLDVCNYLELLLPNTPRIAAWRKMTGRTHVVAAWQIILALFLLPRLTFKTSLIKALCVFAVVLDPDVRIVLGRATEKDAKSTLFGIKSSILSPVIQEAFGDQLKFEKWTESEITLAKRKPGLSDATIATTGLDSSKTGAHPDMAILDDLIHESNYQSAQIMQLAQIKVQAFYPIVERWGSIILMGTRWSELDVYGWVLDEEERRTQTEDGKERWLKKIFSCWKEDECTPKFPTVLPAARIEDLRDNLDPKLFAAWLLNVARANNETIFTLASIQYVDVEEFVPGPFATIELAHTQANEHILKRFGDRVRVVGCMVIDPAPTVGPKSDATGVVLVFFDSERNWWVLYADEVRKLPTDRLNYVCFLARQYYPELVALENADMQAPLLEQKLSDMGLPTKVVSFDPRMDRKKITADAKLSPRGRTKKEAQIESLEPVLRARRVFFSRGDTVPLVRQLLKYPQLQHDDVLDAFSMTLAYERIPAMAVERSEEKILMELERKEFELEGLDFDGDVEEKPKVGVRW